jgi:predicted ArsR family transcriptional regulator
VTDRMPCSACKGQGRVPLPPELQATLTLLRRRGPSSSAELAEALGTKHQAMCNRLVDLSRLGYVQRQMGPRHTLVHAAVPRYSPP